MRLVLSSCLITVWTAACATEPPPAADVEESSLELATAESGPVCRGKARCACFEVDANGNSRKITGSNFAGTCDPDANCAATCDAASCTRGEAQVIGDNCSVASAASDEADIEEEIEADLGDAEDIGVAYAGAPGAGCSCGLTLYGTRYIATAIPDPTRPGFRVSMPAFNYTANIDTSSFGFTCEEACEYGKSGLAATLLGLGDAP